MRACGDKDSVWKRRGNILVAAVTCGLGLMSLLVTVINVARGTAE